MSDKTCRIDQTLKFLGNKWTFLILYNLMDEKKRFKELQYLLNGISPKTLTERLRALEEKEIVIRTIFPVIPPKVEYSITDKGKELKGVFDALNTWGKKYLD
jgi:DNA-binding HxlR family transcriptional regulator